MPAAEVELTDDLVIGLLRAQHPDLLARVELVANGWDNVIYRLGERLAVRLPRRAIAAELLSNEQRWLPILIPHLTLPAPVPVRVGRPTPDYPWPWSITPWFEGRPLAQLEVPRRDRYATVLGRFFAELHHPAPDDAPSNRLRGIPLAERTPRFEQHLTMAPVQNRDHLWSLWQRLTATPRWSRQPLWLHADPHPGNVLIDDNGVTAVVDFGDITAGDPATDLALGWLGFNPSGRARFKQAYTATHGLGQATWQRARGWALCLGVAFLANSDDHPGLRAIGQHAVDQASNHP